MIRITKIFIIAATLPNPVIVYCSVSFMGEGGVLLSTDKKVLMPHAKADCPMGGIHVGNDSKTTMEHLYAVGEPSCSV